MRDWTAIVGTAVFFGVAPGVVAGLVPYWISAWRIPPGIPGQAVLAGLGAVLIAAGLIPLVEAFARFALEGRGTPAPVMPTRELVVGGTYRYVRNPMYVGVVAMIAGQGLLFVAPWLFAYAAAVWLAFHLFVLGYEEPTLRRSYGAQYDAYRAGVPRWLFRLSPWRADKPD